MVGGGSGIGEDHADAWRGGFGVHTVADDAEAMRFDGCVESRLKLGIIDERDGRAVGRDGLAPHLAALEAVREGTETGGAVFDRFPTAAAR